MARRIAICVVSFLAILALVVTGCGPGVGPGPDPGLPAPGPGFGLTATAVPLGNGTAVFTGAPPFALGTRIPVLATANPGFVFIGWTATNGTFVNATLPSTTFIMPGMNATITANFDRAVPATGAMIGELVITEQGSPMISVTRIAGGEIQLRGAVVDVDAYREIVRKGLPYRRNYGAYRDIRYNPVGPVFNRTPPALPELNPFHLPAFRQAMMWLINRAHIRGEYLGGLATDIFALPGARFVESKKRYPDILRNISMYYAPRTPAAVLAMITPLMVGLNATWYNATTPHRWRWGGRDVVLRILIRSDLAPFPRAGDYVATQLESIGFRTERTYGTAAVLSPIWHGGDPALGKWHVATGGWSIGIPRDQASLFAGLQTSTWFATDLFMAYHHQIRTWDDGWPHHLRFRNESYYDLIMRLHRREFSNMTERRAMFERAMWGLTRFSSATMLNDLAIVNVFGRNVNLIVSKGGGLLPTWTQALHFHAAGVPVWRDRMAIEQMTMFVNPWNPEDGSNFVWDLMFKRDGVRETGLVMDPVTGLFHPNRISRAAVTIANALPVMGLVPPWLNFTVLPAGTNITVPPDAWAGWDAELGRWITAAERFPVPADRTALRKSVVVYPDDIFTFPMHDNSTLSLADFLKWWIMRLDIGQPASPIHEPARVAWLTTYMATFRGIRITSVRPLTIEYYSNLWSLDPCWNVATLFPAWRRGGSNPWHMVSIGWLASRDRAAAFGTDRATELLIPWMDFTKGPTLPLLVTRLGNVRTLGHGDFRFIPYRAAIEAAYTTHFGPGGVANLTAEIDTRYANLHAWHAARGHFWVDMGLYQLHSVHPVDRIVVLRRFAAHPDRSDRWMRLLR